MGQILAGRSSEREFRRNLWITTLKRLSSCARTYHAMGYKLYPWGARAPQSCPIDLLWWGKSHENTCFSYYGNLHRDFALIITRHHNVIETWGQAHFTQTTNQHLRIIVKLSSHAPSNHLEHLSNTSERKLGALCHIKVIYYPHKISPQNQTPVCIAPTLASKFFPTWGFLDHVGYLIRGMCCDMFCVFKQ